MSISGNNDWPVLTGAEAAQWDTFSINEKNIESRLLMGWAGYSAFYYLQGRKWFKKASAVHFFCGSGNNGGDGYVMAWHLLSSSSKKIIIWETSPAGSKDAEYFSNLCKSEEVRNKIEFRNFFNIKSDDFSNNDIVVDAIFGTGLNKPPSSEIENIFKAVNSIENIKRVSVDIPSGVYADGEYFEHEAFQADLTLTFGSYKIGHLVEPGILFCKNVKVFPIGFFPKSHEVRRRLLSGFHIPELRQMSGHKYTSGVIKIIGGSKGMEGAALLSSHAFLGLGGGLVKIFSFSNEIAKALNESPEIMLKIVPDVQTLSNDYFNEKFSENEVTVIGPGLKENLGEKFWKNILNNSRLKVIIDGSGLSQLPENEDLFLTNKNGFLLLTPHKAEAEKILGKKILNIREAAIEISKRFSASVYLKGPGGILVLRNGNDIEEIYPNSMHYELSTGGTGDILCGVIANFLCRFSDPLKGAESGLGIYMDTAENLVRKNYEKKDFLTPSEYIKFLRESTL